MEALPLGIRQKHFPSKNSLMKAFAAKGAAVAINYRKSKKEADHVVEAIRSAGGEAVAIQADIRDEEAVQQHGA